MLGIAYHVLYGTPVDPRLTDAFHLQMATFEKLLAPRVPVPAADRPVRGHDAAGVAAAGPGHADDVRPG